MLYEAAVPAHVSCPTPFYNMGARLFNSLLHRAPRFKQLLSLRLCAARAQGFCISSRAAVRATARTAIHRPSEFRRGGVFGLFVCRSLKVIDGIAGQKQPVTVSPVIAGLKHSVTVSIGQRSSLPVSACPCRSDPAYRSAPVSMPRTRGGRGPSRSNRCREFRTDW